MNQILCQKLICKDCFCKSKSLEEYKEYIKIEDYIGDNFYCPQCNQFILGENNNPFNIKYINHIPLYLYVNILRDRFYDTEYIIKYTKEIYNIDLTLKEINNNQYENSALDLPNNNIFNEYRKIKSIDINEDDRTREYFKNKARDYYLKFLQYVKKQYINKNSFNYIGRCFGVLINKGSEVHHIHPLVYNGSNQLENLLLISGWTHDLLHKNPLEKYKECCFHALDYLNYMGNYNYFYLIGKNNIFEKSNGIPEVATKMILNLIEEEMYLYYYKVIK